MHDLAAAGAEVDAAIARRMGLTAGDYLALKHLAVSKDPIGPVELGRMLGISSGAATGLVDRLERAGYARRSPHGHDRRRQILRATTRAQRGMLRELQPLAEDVDRAAAHLTADQRRMVTSILADIAAMHRKYAR
jgi:DNA-binding MarR family transcriptional regulator